MCKLVKKKERNLCDNHNRSCYSEQQNFWCAMASYQNQLFFFFNNWYSTHIVKLIYQLYFVYSSSTVVNIKKTWITRILCATWTLCCFSIGFFVQYVIVLVVSWLLWCQLLPFKASSQWHRPLLFPPWNIVVHHTYMFQPRWSWMALGP